MASMENGPSLLLQFRSGLRLMHPYENEVHMRGDASTLHRLLKESCPQLTAMH